MFDPYHKWLGISSKDQPPNHYRLLSVDLYEKDLEVIEGAADRLMSFVRQYQSGEHAALAAKLLNEIATARLCLLKPALKAEYDAKLKREIAERESAKDDTPSFVNDADIAKFVRSSKPVPKPPSKPVPKRKKKNAKLPPFEYLLAGVAIIVILLPVLAFMGPKWGQRTHQSVVPAKNSNVPVPTVPAPRPIAPSNVMTDPVPKPVSAPETTRAPERPDAVPTASMPPVVPDDAIGPAVDLLNMVDLSRDLFSGNWKKDGSAYVGGPHAASYLPARLPEDYQLRLKVKRTSGIDTFFLGFLMAGRQGSVAFDAYNSEMSGLFVGSTELRGFCATGPGSLLKNGQVSNVVLVIHPRHFTAKVDGATIIDWHGDPSRLMSGGPNRESATMAVAQATFRIESAIMVPIPPEPVEERAERLTSEVDVMPLLDATRDTERGVWSVNKNVLHSPDATGSLDLYSLPIAVPEEYTLSMNVEIALDARPKEILVIGLVAGHTSFTIPIVDLGGNLGIEQIDGVRWIANETIMRGKYLARGKQAKIVCTVTKQRISLEIDGRLLVNWTGDQRRLSVQENWSSRDGRKLFLGTETHFKLSDIKVGPPVELSNVIRRTVSKTGRVVDLLALIDPNRDSLEGTWIKDKNSLRVMGDVANNKLVIPCEVPEEYRLKLRVAREKGGKVENDTLMLNLPVGPYTANVSINAVGSTVSGIHLDRLNVNDPKNPSTYKGRVIPMGGLRDIEVTVRKNYVKVVLGSKEVLNWVGNPARLWMNAEWSTPSGMIGIGSWGSRLRFEKLELEPLESDNADSFPPVADFDDSGNLLAIINPVRDSRMGDWKIDQGALICPALSPARLRIPTPIMKQYCLSANVERISGQNDFILGLVAGGHSCTAVIDGFNSTQAALIDVDGKSFSDEMNLTRRVYASPLFPAGQKIPIQCFVLFDTIIVNCAGKEVIRWHGDPRRLSGAIGYQPPNYSEDDETHLWLGAWEASFAIRDLKLKPLSEEEAARISESFSGPFPTSSQSNLAPATIQPK